MNREVGDDSGHDDGPPPDLRSLRGSGQRILIAAGPDDADSAERLRNSLSDRGFRATCATAPDGDGQALADAVDRTDFVVALLSSRSLPRSGPPAAALSRTLSLVGRQRSHAMYLLPVRLDEVEPSTLDARHLEVIDLFPDWENGEGEIVRTVVSNYGRWDLESRHFMLLGFGTFFVAAIAALVLVVLPRVIDDDWSITSVLIGCIITFGWCYGTFMASAWFGSWLAGWARGRRLPREWAWRAFAVLVLAVTAATLLLL